MPLKGGVQPSHSLPQVKKALCVLIQHNLVRYEVQPRGSVEYEARSERILRILRYPRYIYTAKTLYGDPGELLVEELLLHGHLPMSCAVARVTDRLTETMEGGKEASPSKKKGSGSKLVGEWDQRHCRVFTARLWWWPWCHRVVLSLGNIQDLVLGRLMKTMEGGKLLKTQGFGTGFVNVISESLWGAHGRGSEHGMTTFSEASGASQIHPLCLSSHLDGKTMDYMEVSSTFVRLADTHFIQRCPMVPESPRSTKAPPPPAPALVIAEKDMYVVPRLSLVGESPWDLGIWGASGSTQPRVEAIMMGLMGNSILG